MKKQKTIIEHWLDTRKLEPGKWYFFVGCSMLGKDGRMHISWEQFENDEK